MQFLIFVCIYKAVPKVAKPPWGFKRYLEDLNKSYHLFDTFHVLDIMLNAWCIIPFSTHHYISLV